MKLSHNEFRERFPNATITAWVKYRYCGGSIPGLPKEYQAVDYIEATGTQWIDTGVYGNQDTNVTIDVTFTNNAAGINRLFGDYADINKAISIYCSDTANQRFGNVSVSKNVYRSTAIYIINKNGIYIDNILDLNLDYSGSFTTMETLNLFSTNKTSTGGTYGKIRRCEIKEVDTIIRNFIPCYRKSDNEIGMYDTVNGVFYTNSGTGTFTKGENI